MTIAIQPDQNRQKIAQQYARIMRRLSRVELLFSGGMLLVIIFTGFSNLVSQFLSIPQPWASAVYSLILTFGFIILTLPLDYFKGYALPRRYNLYHATIKVWISDQIKSLAISLIIGLLLIICIYWLLAITPATWWIWAGIIVIIISLILARLTPTVLISLFFKVEPLNNTELETGIKEMAERAGTVVTGIYTMNLSSKSDTANAMLAGLGKTRRIILSDTLLQKYTTEEIEVILAHELAHHIHRDIPRLLIVQSIVILMTFKIADLVLFNSMSLFNYNNVTDIATLPIMVLVASVFTLLISPFINSFSRNIEARADHTALELSQQPDAFISAMTKLIDQNLSEAKPATWVELLLYDHPPYWKRVRMAEQYKTLESIHQNR